MSFNFDQNPFDDGMWEVAAKAALVGLRIFVFALAFLILLEVSYAPL